MMDVAGIMAYIRDLVGQLQKRQRSIVRRVSITGTADTGKVRTLQVQGIADQVDDDVEHLEPFGFTSNPPTGAEGLKLLVGGDPAHPVIAVVFDRRYRMVGLQPGETAMFNQWGDYAKFDAGRNITLNAGADVNVTAATKVNVTAPNAEFTGNVKIDGTLAVSKLATFNSGASIAGGNFLVGGVGQILITTGPIKVAGVPLNVP